MSSSKKYVIDIGVTQFVPEVSLGVTKLGHLATVEAELVRCWRDRPLAVGPCFRKTIELLLSHNPRLSTKNTQQEIMTAEEIWGYSVIQQ